MVGSDDETRMQLADSVEMFISEIIRCEGYRLPGYERNSVWADRCNHGICSAQ